MKSYNDPQKFRRALTNRRFESIEALHEAIMQTTEIYWHTPEKLESLTGFGWWWEAVDQIYSQQSRTVLELWAKAPDKH